MANISFRSFLGLLCGIQFWLYAEVHGGMIEKHALIGQQVNLTCYLNSTGKVSWLYEIGKRFFTIYTCENGECMLPAGADEDIVEIFSRKVDHIEVTQRNETSNFSLTPSNEKQYDFKCKLGNDILQEYSVKTIHQRNIVPNCTVTLPSSNANGVRGGIVTLSCEVTSGELDVNLTLEGVGLNVLNDAPGSSQSIKAKTINFSNFTNIHNASCNACFPYFHENRSCIYPNIIQAHNIAEGNDIIIKCDDVNQWRFYTSDGREEEIEDRSWIREGGRSLLIRNISEEDVGKVVVCRTRGDDNQTNKGTIGFHVISKISGDSNKPNSEGPTTTPNAQNPYLVPTLLFLTLWLITTAVGGVWWGCTPKRNKSGTVAIASASGNASEPNGGSGERETHLLNIRTRARGDPETLNTNNSAHNQSFEPEVNSAGENSRNRQSNNENHLYFTLEKSSPSPVNSLPRASTARWEHPDANPASLNHPQRESSHSQCYETVGEPNKGATISYDLGEYAEVGYGKGPPDRGEYAEVGGRFQEKGPPDLSDRPSIRKKPERKKVKEDDISRLYGKVNK